MCQFSKLTTGDFGTMTEVKQIVCFNCFTKNDWKDIPVVYVGHQVFEDKSYDVFSIMNNEKTHCVNCGEPFTEYMELCVE